jgi:integrase
MATTQPIRDVKQIQMLATYYQKRGEIRNFVLLVLSVHTGLRISDILRLRWDDVYDFNTNTVREQFHITEKKTGKSKHVTLNQAVVRALTLYADNARHGASLIQNKRTGKAISRIQAYRVIRSAASALQLPDKISCHSLRKTFGYHAWKFGHSPVLLMKIYNHSSYYVTSRYLGITQDEINKVYTDMDFGISLQVTM